MRNIIDLTGQKFGRLTVVEIARERRNNKIMWYCRCSCGVSRLFRGASLVSGKTRSCGCFKDEMRKGMVREKNYNWKGGTKVSDGYVYVLDRNNPNADKS